MEDILNKKTPNLKGYYTLRYIIPLGLIISILFSLIYDIINGFRISDLLDIFVPFLLGAIGLFPPLANFRQIVVDKNGIIINEKLINWDMIQNISQNYVGLVQIDYLEDSHKKRITTANMANIFWTESKYVQYLKRLKNNTN